MLKGGNSRIVVEAIKNWIDKQRKALEQAKEALEHASSALQQTPCLCRQDKQCMRCAAIDEIKQIAEVLGNG